MGRSETTNSNDSRKALDKQRADRKRQRLQARAKIEREKKLEKQNFQLNMKRLSDDTSDEEDEDDNDDEENGGKVQRVFSIPDKKRGRYSCNLDRDDMSDAKEEDDEDCQDDDQFEVDEDEDDEDDNEDEERATARYNQKVDPPKQKATIGGTATYRTPEEEMAKARNVTDAKSDKKGRIVPTPQRIFDNHASTPAVHIKITNDKDSVQQLVRSFVKKVLFKKVKFWDKDTYGMYSVQPKTVCSLFFQENSFPKAMSHDTRAGHWYSYLPLVGTLHTDHRNNCIKAMKKSYQSKLFHLLPCRTWFLFAAFDCINIIITLRVWAP